MEDKIQKRLTELEAEEAQLTAALQQRIAQAQQYIQEHNEYCNDTQRRIFACQTAKEELRGLLSSVEDGEGGEVVK